MKKEVISTTLRVPVDLLVEIKHKAVDNRRSVNAEILALIDEGKKAREQNATA